MENNQIAANIAEVYSSINLFDALDESDPRYVDTEKARGDFKFSKLLKSLNVNASNYTFYNNSAFFCCFNWHCSNTTAFGGNRIQLFAYCLNINN